MNFNINFATENGWGGPLARLAVNSYTKLFCDISWTKLGMDQVDGAT